jgi:hypothetical protein
MGRLLRSRLGRKISGPAGKWHIAGVGTAVGHIDNAVT